MSDIPFEFAFRWLSLDRTDDKSTLVQVMVWCRQATSHHLGQCWPRSLSPYGVTRPQWVLIMKGIEWFAEGLLIRNNFYIHLISMHLHIEISLSQLWNTRVTFHKLCFFHNSNSLENFFCCSLITSLWTTTNLFRCNHYNDVIMSTMTSHITSLTIVYSTVYSGTDQRKHQSSASLTFVQWIHRWPVNSPHKWPVMQNLVSIWWRHHVWQHSYCGMYKHCNDHLIRIGMRVK